MRAHDFASGLPIAPLLPDVVTSLRSEPNLVLEAPPGAGKSTAVPLALLRDGGFADGIIMVLEPRRVAARAAAARMASLLGQPLGGEVGYRVRHESKTSRETRVLVVTEGVLVNKLQADPTLEGVACVIFDEFHERSVDADLALALCREAQTELRPELRLVVMSATLGEALGPAVAATLGGCPTLTSDGRCFPVERRHLSGSRPLALAAAGHPREVEEAVAEAVLSALAESAQGDLLVFLPGEREIRGVESRLADALPAARRAALRVCPLFGAMPLEEQRAAVAPDPEGRRRVVLSTNLAESSLTIEGVRLVIDSGLRRAAAYDAAVGMSALVTRPISAAAAEQRAGRAGRVAPGTAYRLWSEQEHLRLAPQTEPEIAQADLAPLLLQLGAWGAGVSDEAAAALPWVTPPPAASLERARTLLSGLGALGGGAAALTPHGTALARLPAHPRLAHVLLRAAAAASGDAGGAALEVASAAVAVVEERDVLAGGGRAHGADLRSRVACLLEAEPGPQAATGAWRRAKRNALDLAAQAGRVGRTVEAARRSTPTLEAQVETVGALLSGGYFDRIAQRQPGKENTFSLSNGRGASFAAAAEPLASAEYLVCLSLDGGDKRSARIHLAAPLSLSELRAALAGSAIRWSDDVFVAPSDGSVRARRVERLGALILSQEPLPTPPPEQARPLLLSLLRERGLRRALFGGEGGVTHPALELIARVRLLRALDPKGGWPVWDEAGLMAGAEDHAGWLVPALATATSLKQLAAADLPVLLEQSLPHALQTRLRMEAPARLEVPSGALVQLNYGSGGAATPPVLAAKLQEFFGAVDTPTVGPRGAALPVLLHLLTPAGRAAAITADLPSFWAGPYAQVRAELRDKYKRHPWPDDPANAEPTRLSNRALAKQAASGGGRASTGESGAGSGEGGAKRRKQGGGKAKTAPKPQKAGKLPGGKRGPFKRR
ncbi:hypothetical protein EMIHUDRAFT_62179 [Emiliania huxleyi CCMP1516]|uniref:ATP-dependent helicase HrpB n=3 Tax=Emiliania huxleyi TaxID=2903 RepID=A0A0D3I7L3_EMIH1|nr:hypothetical protein EMIHUDRAFT_62179 [Emiliania huxleyi CCMP1516]EOD07248.1 hypothetical protein EMIHUDRAFT_62179 [Emiliania huxleyi CCMP1516]|eukprot:XP_005759677.1 hypothetical protein EMIHUDRAFT_62179 [Emiliania huxleyi CCMP1516]